MKEIKLEGHARPCDIAFYNDDGSIIHITFQKHEMQSIARELETVARQLRDYVQSNSPADPVLITSLLKNQKQWNKDSGNSDYTNDLLCQVARETFLKLINLNNIVTIKPMVSQTDIIEYHYFQDNQNGIDLISAMEPVVAKTRALKTNFFEGDVTTLSNGIAKETIEEVLNDLMNNVGTVASIDISKFTDPAMAIVTKLDELKHFIFDKTHRGGDLWIVANSKLIKTLNLTQHESFKPNADEQLLKRLGFLNKCALYEYEMEDNYILTGFKGLTSLDSGYFYYVHVPLCYKLNHPLYIKPHMMYAKKLVRCGGDHYARLKIEGLS
ncbi:MAG: hypothetical protein DWQ19_12185 [Crenarchaeota archaeon]|nr:MAG: hypothetical protein DWQ19_12185 [Thermoproteota archaeon]